MVGDGGHCACAFPASVRIRDVPADSGRKGAILDRRRTRVVGTTGGAGQRPRCGALPVCAWLPVECQPGAVPFAVRVLLLRRIRGKDGAAHPQRPSGLGDPGRRRAGVLRSGLRLADVGAVVFRYQRHQVLIERYSVKISEFPISRQRVLLGAGLGLVTAVLAACSTYGKKPEAAGEPSTTSAPPASAGSAAPAANV